jgi:hypothetical protein
MKQKLKIPDDKEKQNFFPAIGHHFALGALNQVFPCRSAAIFAAERNCKKRLRSLPWPRFAG